jgi:hypothetical protein
MDAFEQLIATFLEAEGFWVRSSYKVRLRASEKLRIGRPSAPRWEVDLVAYKAGTNELRLVECKSFLDSGGVGITAFDGSNEAFANRFKLFNNEELRRTVRHRLVRQLVMAGSCAPRPRVTWCLATGKIAAGRSRKLLHAHFEERRWLLMDEDWIAERLRAMSEGSYENDVATMVAKLLLRAERKAVAADADG